MIRLGIVGTGIMAQVHSENFSRIPGVRLTGFYHKQPDPPVDLAEKYNAKLFGSIDGFLSFNELDAVAICSPTPSHYELAITFLDSGKHVFLEKPIARSMQEAKSILDVASKSKGKLMVGHVVRFCHEYVHAKKLIENVAIGTVGVVRTARRGRFPRGIGNWYADFQQSGGVILDMLIHDLDYLRWCFGPVQRLYASSLVSDLRDQRDFALIIIRFQNGVIAHVEGSWTYDGEFHTEYEIVGEKGLITFKGLETAPLRLLMKRQNDGPDRVSIPRPSLNESPYYVEALHFVKCIIEDQKPLTGAEEGTEALHIATAALESAQRGQPVDL